MIKLSKPFFPPEAIETATAVLKSGNLVQGEYVLKFEKELSAFLNVKHAVVVSNGTAALHLSLLSLGIGPGDEVIVPAFTFPATANVVELVGARPVFVDIGLDDFCIDTAKIEQAITPNTRVIMPVHEFGQSAKMDVIMQIAGSHGLTVVEDAACALGAEFQGRKAGTFGMLGCYSFHPRKAITTGEGGAIVTNDDNLASKLRILRNHGIEQIDGFNDFSLAGFNYRMTDFQAALGYCQMSEISYYIRKRIEIADQYSSGLSSCTAIKTPTVLPGRTNVYQTYHVLVDGRFNRDILKKKLFGNGIETNYGANALQVLKFYREKYGLKPGDFPNALYSFRQGLALPISLYIGYKEINYVCDQIKSLTNYHEPDKAI